MQNVENIENITSFLWMLYISFILTFIGINYIFIKLGLPTKGFKRYGKIKDVLTPNTLVIDYKFLLFWRKTCTIKVRYISDKISDKNLNNLRNFLINKNVRFMKIHNIFEMIKLSKPLSIIRALVKLGDTYEVEILDDKTYELKYIPKIVIPGKNYVNVVIDNGYCEFEKSNILGIVDRRIYSNMLNK